VSWIRTPATNKHGINEFVRPTVKYVKCHDCGGNVELWSDEKEGVCISCGAMWTKPDDTASCLEYCEYADQCRQIINSR
jgi:ribosomal protein S27E